MRKLLAVLMCVAALAACSSDPVEGEVVNKGIRPASVYIYYQPIYSTTCSGSGSYRMCHQIQIGSIPIDMSRPECPQLKVRNSKGKIKEVCISMHEFEGTYIGQHYKEYK